MIRRALAAARRLLGDSSAGALQRLTDTLVDKAIWLAIGLVGLAVAAAAQLLWSSSDPPQKAADPPAASATYDDGFVERRDGGPGFAFLAPLIAHLRGQGVSVEWTIAAPVVAYCRPLGPGPLPTDDLLDRVEARLPDCLAIEHADGGVRLSPHAEAHGPVPVRPDGTDAYFCGCDLANGAPDQALIRGIRRQLGVLHR